MKRPLVLLSPVGIIAVVHFLAVWAHAAVPAAAWVVVALAYWALMAVVVLLTTDPAQRRTWFRAGGRAPVWAYVAAAALGLFPMLGILLLNLDLLAMHSGLILPWLLFALINPLMEETYWRGALMDARGGWPFWLMAAYSTVFFVLSHPLMWGVFSVGNRSIAMYFSLAAMGLVWAYIRRSAGNLRIPLWSHALVDVGNMSVFVFINAYVPPGM